MTWLGSGLLSAHDDVISFSMTSGNIFRCELADLALEVLAGQAGGIYLQHFLFRMSLWTYVCVPAMAVTIESSSKRMDIEDIKEMASFHT